MHGRPLGKLKAAASAFYRKEQKETNPFLAGIAAIAANESVEVWPENWPAFTLFIRLQTQWRTGMNGKTGLDYNVLLPLIERMKLTDKESLEMLDDVQTLEIAALNEMYPPEE